VEIICLVVESYCNVFADKAPEPFRPAIDRIINGIDLKNCVVNPHFTAVLLKLIIDGLQYFRPHLVPEKVLDKLFFIFFHYNTALEYMSTLRENPQIGRKALPIIEEFARQSDDMKKRMKQLVVKYKSDVIVGLLFKLVTSRCKTSTLLSAETSSNWTCTSSTPARSST
jgi:hypothetical protein